jgi:stress response protein YsnF
LLLVEEVLLVGTRRVETGYMLISVVSKAEERLVRETLRSERAEMERVNIGRELTEGEAAPIARQGEGGIFILPVLEEAPVIERRLVLHEKIRLRFVIAEETTEEAVTLRR